MKTLAAKQQEFNELMDIGFSPFPELNYENLNLAYKLIKEEFSELGYEIEAALNHTMHSGPVDDEAEIMKNICAESVDLVYVILQLCNQLGLPFTNMFDEIHSANMRKRGPNGKISKNHYGKVVKPEGWKPANKDKIMKNSLRK